VTPSNFLAEFRKNAGQMTSEVGSCDGCELKRAITKKLSFFGGKKGDTVSCRPE